MTSTCSSNLLGSRPPVLSVLGFGLLGLLCMPMTVGAQERPFGIAVRQSATYDSNVLRLPAGIAPPPGSGLSSRGDWFSATSLSADYANTFGAQYVRASIDFTALRFQNLADRDSNAYTVRGNWNGDLGRAWFVAADASRSRFLVALVNQPGLERNDRTVHTLGLSLGRRLTTNWSLVGRTDYTDISNSAASFRQTDRRIRGVEAGVRYQPQSGIEASVVFRRVDGSSPVAQRADVLGFPVFQPVDTSFTQDQVVVRGRYVVTGKSTFDGEAGLSRLSFNAPQLTGFSGVLFGASYNYALSDVLALSATARRDLTNTAVAFAAPVDQWSLVLGATWHLTGRTSVSAAIEARRLNFFAEPSAVALDRSNRVDDLRSVSLNVSYELLRTVFLTGSLQRFERRSTFAGLNTSANIATVGAEWRFR